MARSQKDLIFQMLRNRWRSQPGLLTTHLLRRRKQLNLQGGTR